MVRQAIEQGGCHFGVAEDARPFREAEIGSDDDAGALVELAEEVEQQGAARSTERQIAKLVQDYEVASQQPSGDLADLALRLGLTRFGGHPEAFTRGANDAQIPTALFT